MKTKLLMVFMGFLLLMQFSCIEEYWPELGDKYDELLVVNGMITSRPGPYTIRLSHSSALRYVKTTPFRGCTVSITDNKGFSEALSEMAPGEYVTTDPAFRGIVGRQYKLKIHTPGEQIYESDFQELKAPVGIDTVYARLESHTNPDAERKLVGYQFYVSSEAASGDTNYFFWRMEQTYEFNSNYRIRYIFDGKLNPVTYPTPFYTCWKTSTVPEIFTFNTSQLNESLIRDLPLHYITTETKELSIKYSVLVKQLTLTKEAFNFWNKLKEQGAGQGSLYNKQPYQIRSNLVNVNQPDEPVLGYFLVAGCDEKRIFLDKPSGVQFYYNTSCGWVTDDLFRMLDAIKYKWPVFLTILFEEEDGNGVIALPSDQVCLDCREDDGDTEKPEFWED